MNVVRFDISLKFQTKNNEIFFRYNKIQFLEKHQLKTQ